MKTTSFRNGFTLIEVMVATAVLLIMVLMVGSLFRSAASSWDSGYARAEGGSIVRGVAGSIARDLSTAVDGRAYGKTSDIIDVSSSSLKFVCFKPIKTVGGTTRRELHCVEYSLGSSVTRKDSVLTGSSWAALPSTILYAGGDSSFGAKFELSSASPASSTDVPDRPYEASGDYKWNIPSVKLRCTLTREGSFSGLSILCLGPDGKEGLSEGSKDNDDIVVK